jgi:hypothetical protein
MQIALFSMHHVTCRALPSGSGSVKDSIVGGRWLLMCRAPSTPRATRHPQPACRPVQLRCYTQDRPADSTEPPAP